MAMPEIEDKNAAKESDKKSGEARACSRNENFLEIFAWVCAAVAFFPAAVWLWDGLIQSQQLSEAIIILVSAILVMAIEYKIRPHRPIFNRSAAGWLIFAYIALFSAKFLGVWGVFLALAGFSAVLISIGLACFDRKQYVYAAGGGFYAFTILSIFIKVFDLPLRILAGKLSAWILSLADNSVALMMLKGDTPQIAMNVNGATYLVATECNGFGIIAACIILAIVSAIFRKEGGVVRRSIAVVVCALIAYVANSFRIVAIVTAAPLVGKANYHFFHELFGYIFFALALIVVWKLSRKI